MPSRMIKEGDLQKFKDLVDRASTIAIASHVNPDGDNLGSSLALARSLEKYGKKVDVIKNSTIDDYLSFLPETSRYNENFKDAYDLFIILDCSEFDRIGEAQEILKKSKKSIVVDHHVQGKITGDLMLIFEKAPATCQLIYEIIDGLGLPLDETIATLLFTGICTDTGRFMYSNVSEETFLIAGRLLSLGADTATIYKNLYQSKPLNKLKFETEIIEKASFFEDKVFAWANQDLCKKYQVQIGESETVVNELRDIKQVEVAMLLKESEEGDFKVSLRSKNRVDVSKIARENGGGGHIRASGFTIFAKDFDEAKATCLEILKAI